jgi:hypothetical protein
LSQGGRRGQRGNTQRQFQFGVQHKIQALSLIQVFEDLVAIFRLPRLFLDPGNTPGTMSDTQVAELESALETNPGVSSPHKPIFTESR